MKKILYFFVFVIIFILIIPLLLGIPYPQSDYYLKSGWNCDSENFNSEYKQLYSCEIERLKTKHELVCYEHFELETTKAGNVDKFIFYLYCDEYTIEISLLNNNTIGFYNIVLYYYGESEYEDFKNIVDFIDDFTNYAAFDSKTDTNYFEKLYYESTDKGYASYEYHFDDIVGGVSYSVDREFDGGYYYMLQKDSSVEKTSSVFRFKGLLKPLMEK